MCMLQACRASARKLGMYGGRSCWSASGAHRTTVSRVRMRVVSHQRLTALEACVTIAVAHLCRPFVPSRIAVAPHCRILPGVRAQGEA